MLLMDAKYATDMAVYPEERAKGLDSHLIFVKAWTAEVIRGKEELARAT